MIKSKIIEGLQKNFLRYSPLGLVMLVATLTRLWFLPSIPFMHDEFSALFRTGYGSWTELIRQGVVPDAHPAGTQLLIEFMTIIFGWDEFWLKLPFVMMGIASVWLVYLIGKTVFGKSAGLFASSLLAVMQFFVFYSQLARPYSAGLFFVLLAFYSGIKISGSATCKSRCGNSLVFVMALVLASMMHYFAMMMAAFVYLGVLMMAEKGQRKHILLVGVAAALFYMPNIRITLKQVAAGGIGDWLAKPGSDFLPQFLAYTFHFSWFFAIIVILTFAFSAQIKGFLSGSAKWQLLFIAWFVLTFLIGWFYSVLRTPVIQYSTLYFSFPFLILGLSGFIKPLSDARNIIITSVVIISGLSTLVLDRRHFYLMSHQGYEQIAVEFDKIRKKHDDQIAMAAVGGSSRMLIFYQQKIGNKTVRLFNKDEDKADFELFLDSIKTNYFAVGWTDYTPFNWIESARARFPYLILQRNWFNSGYYLFTKDSTVASICKPAERIVFSQSDYKGLKTFASEDAFGLLWEADYDSLKKKNDGIIVSGLELMPVGQVKDVGLVMEIKQEGQSKPFLWRSGTPDGRVFERDKKAWLIVSYHLDSGPAIPPGSKLRLYVWNKKNEAFIVTKRWLRIIDYDPVLFGFYAPL